MERLVNEDLAVRKRPGQHAAIKSMRRSPMELDIYCWLTYRMFSLSRPFFLTYDLLRLQFGASYTNVRDFKLNVDKALLDRAQALPSGPGGGQRPGEGQEGWRLLPSPPHVPEAKFVPGKFDKPRRRLT